MKKFLSAFIFTILIVTFFLPGTIKVYGAGEGITIDDTGVQVSQNPVDESGETDYKKLFEEKIAEHERHVQSKSLLKYFLWIVVLAGVGAGVFLFIKKPNVKTVVKTAGELMGNICPAAPTAGEMTFTQALHAPGGILPGIEAGPIKYLLGSVGRITKGISGVIRDKKRIIPVLVISLLWLVLLLLPVLGVKASVINWLSFFTFARGGTGGGLLGMAGGLIGKGLLCQFFIRSARAKYRAPLT